MSQIAAMPVPTPDGNCIAPAASGSIFARLCHSDGRRRQCTHFENGLVTTSDDALDAATVHDVLPLPDWQAVAPTIGIRSIAAIMLIVPLLLVAGVCWLHQLPSVIGSETSSDVIEVRLVGPQASNTHGHDVAEPATPMQAADPLIDDRDYTIPAETVAPMPPELQRPAPAKVGAIPALSAIQTQGVLNQKATTFQRILLSHIARYRQYPEGIRRGRANVQLVFAMLRDGTVTDVRITSSSGDAILDHAAIETIRKAEPMPKIPAELPEHLNILVPLMFEGR